MSHLSLTPSYKLRLDNTNNLEFKFIGISEVAPGGDHSCLIDNTNKVWSWGYNIYGQVGDNTNINKSNPIPIYGNKTFYRLSSNAYFTMGIINNQAWGWGNNQYGQLGNNSTINKNTPIKVSYIDSNDICRISLGYGHVLILNSTGSFYSWGSNIHGQLGLNDTVNRCQPSGDQDFTHTFCNISAGSNHSLAIDNYGKLWGWGYNIYGQLGDNTYDNKSTPVAICNSLYFDKISGGDYHSMAIDINNSHAWGWGYNDLGQLGNNISNECKETPILVFGNHQYGSISCGSKYTLALSGYEAWTWGHNNIGQLGDNTTQNRSTPVLVYGNHSFIKIKCIYNSSFGIDSNGKLWIWGYHVISELNGKQPYYSTPVAISI